MSAIAIPDEYSLRSLPIESTRLNRELPKGFSWDECLRSTGGHISQLKFSVGIPECTPIPIEELRATYGDDYREPTAEEKAKRPVFGEYRIQIDSRKISKLEVDPWALLSSGFKCGEFYVFTCSCGFPECAGVFEGIRVYHRDGKTLWITTGLKPREVFIFNTEDYQDAIVGGLMEAAEAVPVLGIQTFPPDYVEGMMPSDLLYRIPEIKAERKGRWVKIPPFLLDAVSARLKAEGRE